MEKVRSSQVAIISKNTVFSGRYREVIVNIERIKCRASVDTGAFYLSSTIISPINPKKKKKEKMAKLAILAKWLSVRLRTKW